MKFIIPLYIKLSQNWKKYHLNFNKFRNRHYQVSNSIKKAVSNIVKEQLLLIEKNKISQLSKQSGIIIAYQVYYPDLRKRDKGNIYSIVQKFFLDSLVENGVLIDDNDSIIWDEIFKKPIIDKNNGRVEILINNK